MYLFKLDSTSISFSSWFEILFVKSTTFKALDNQGGFYLSQRETIFHLDKKGKLFDFLFDIALD